MSKFETSLDSINHISEKEPEVVEKIVEVPVEKIVEKVVVKEVDTPRGILVKPDRN